MKNEYVNTLGSERTVEVLFLQEAVKNYYKSGDALLDVGGVPTSSDWLSDFYNFINTNNIRYDISDFRPCKYQGDFVQYDFKDEKFDMIIFLSSLEHFPQCTESDVIFREGYDRAGYQKALNTLNDGGYIILTVPFGKHVWQPYHQNYNWEGILQLTEGSTIVEHYTYSLQDGNSKWILTDPALMEDLLCTDRVYGVGCFVLQKNKK